MAWFLGHELLRKLLLLHERRLPTCRWLRGDSGLRSATKGDTEAFQTPLFWWRLARKISNLKREGWFNMDQGSMAAWKEQFEHVLREILSHEPLQMLMRSEASKTNRGHRASSLERQR